MNPQPNLEEVSSTSAAVSSSLKRKRPPNIEIPIVLQEIGVEKIKSRDFTPRNQVFRFRGGGVGVFSVKGKKKFMEDTYTIMTNQGFFGVYDGHGGKKASEFVADNLHTNVLEMLENCTGDVSKIEAVKSGYLKTDEEFLKLGTTSGACCVTALIKGNELLVSNVGDCRAVLCRGGLAEVISIDHRGERLDERERIEEKGGFVEIHRGAWRVNGTLAVTRSIGDAQLKDWVVAEPDTKIMQLASDMEFLILASDGLWDEVGNEEAVKIVTQMRSPGKKLGFTETWFPGDENDDHVHVNVSPMSKIRRISLVKQQHKGGGSSLSPRYNKNVDKDKENGYACENEGPPSKMRRISHKIVDSENEIPSLKFRRFFPSEEDSQGKKSSASEWLLSAGKELANLAISRGSLDDITIMIIDVSTMIS